MYTDEQLLKLEAEDFLLANPKLYRVIYNQALEDCRKMCGADTPHYTNCIGCPLAHFENDFDTTICKLEQLKKQNKYLI